MPTFVFHLLVGPVLKLFEERRIDDGEAQANATLIAHPHNSRLGTKDHFGVGKREAHIEQPGKFHGLWKPIQSHAARAQVHALDLNLITPLVLQRDRQLNARPKEFLLLKTDESERGRALSGCDVDVVLLQLAAEGAAGNTQLVCRLGAMAATPLEGADIGRAHVWTPVT